MDRELEIERIAAGPARERLIPLLLLADESEQEVRGYVQLGDLYALWAIGADSSREPVGVVLVVPALDATAMELKAVAVAPAWQQRGVGKQMLANVVADLRNRQVRRVIVGTSNAGIGQFAFYQKSGFRFWRIERDFFTPERGYNPDVRENGLPHRDMIWFDQEL